MLDINPKSQEFMIYIAQEPTPPKRRAGVVGWGLSLLAFVMACIGLCTCTSGRLDN